uniref:Bromodomain adjacent to zinc finger domain 2A n=1 Tax=Gallus gallus TaxID=9031 RepID=A0A8V1A1H0_CHICK
MDTDNHFGFAGIPPAPTASGLKPTAPSSGDNPYSNGAALSFPPQGKSLNGGMNVNGFSTVSHTTTSGTFTSSTHSSGPPPHLHHPYDCLWDYTQFQPPGGLKDGSLAQFPLNGVSGGSRPPSPGHGANLRAAGTELWGNGTSGSMGLNFDSQELYDSFPEQSFELLPNGPTSFYAAPQPSPLLGSGEPPFPLPEEDLGGDADDAEASKELQPSSMAENGAGLVGSMELEDAQPGRSAAGGGGCGVGLC